MKQNKIIRNADLTICTPHYPEAQSFNDATQAVEHLIKLYEISTNFLREAFNDLSNGKTPDKRFRAFYPEIRFENY